MLCTGTVAVSSSILHPFILKNWNCFVGIGECLKFYMWLFVDYNSSNVISSGETVSKNDSKFLKNYFSPTWWKWSRRSWHSTLATTFCRRMLSPKVLTSSSATRPTFSGKIWRISRLKSFCKFRILWPVSKLCLGSLFVSCLVLPLTVPPPPPFNEAVVCAPCLSCGVGSIPIKPKLLIFLLGIKW